MCADFVAAALARFRSAPSAVAREVCGSVDHPAFTPSRLDKCADRPGGLGRHLGLDAQPAACERRQLHVHLAVAAQAVIGLDDENVHASGCRITHLRRPACHRSRRLH